MGFWNNDVDNNFDAMFDFDRDGTLDVAERAAQLDYIQQEDEEIERGLGDWDDYDDDDDWD